jgi:DNA modification methylase/ParB-like chromosome segregation protein Spo0J
MKVEVSKLKIHPFHKRIYLINEIDALANDIKKNGLLQSLVIDENQYIVSGVRRLYAVKKLGWDKVEVEIMNLNGKDEKQTIVAFNKQREKTNREKLNEARYMKALWRKKRGRKSEAEKPQITENVKPANTRKDVCEELGYSTGNFVKLEYIDSQRPDLIDEIDNGNISINQAHKALKKIEEEKSMLHIEATLPTTITNSSYTIYNKSSDDLSDLKDESIQTIFTSPPYWNKRTYSDDKNELGSEKTSEEFVQRMATHLHACHRVLNNKGSFFLNMGDTYFNKCLQIIPHRIVIELVKKGWILRQTIIWKKTNTLSSTVKNTVTCSHEYIFHLVKSHSYDYKQILVPTKTKNTNGVTVFSRKCKNGGLSDYGKVSINGLKDGKKLEDYWTEDVVTTACANQSIFKHYGDHPAPFVSEIVTLPILQTSKPGDIVLDPFSGTATVGEVAILLGRRYVGYEFNANHNDLQTRRLDAAIEKYNKAELKKAA